MALGEIICNGGPQALLSVHWLLRFVEEFPQCATEVNKNARNEAAEAVALCLRQDAGVSRVRLPLSLGEESK